MVLDDLLRLGRRRRRLRRRVLLLLLRRRRLGLGEVGWEGHGLHVHGPRWRLVLQLLHRGVSRGLQRRLRLRLDLH